jgi:uncharacterized protein YbjT (DUF2867 family)
VPRSHEHRVRGVAEHVAPVAVVGATGVVGEEICRRLRARGEEVRALVRATSDPPSKARLEALGVRMFEGDV